MSPELAVRIAQHETEGQPLNIQMRRANEVFKANSAHWQQPFAPVDVAFATFVDYLRSTGSQRERDLVLVSDKLCRVWTAVHITVQCMGERPAPMDEEDLAMLAPALQRLGLLHLLTDDLRTDLCQWVQTAAEQN